MTACRPLSAHNGCRSWRAAIIAICWTPGSAAITRTAGAPGRSALLQEALSAQYPVSIVAIPGPRQHIQAHITLHDGAPLTLDLWPKLPAIARWLPVVLIAQFVPPAGLRLVRGSPGLLPISRFTHAVNAPEPASDTAGTMAEQGPEEGASRRPRV